MKKDWTPEDLIEAFSMTSEEVNWVYGATPHNVLGKAVLLKVFQHQGRFPEDLREIPDEVVAYIAQQVGMPEIIFSDYQWAGRTAERHRQTIREYLGFHQCSTAAFDDLVDWLVQHPVMRHEHDIPAFKSLAYTRLYDQQIEPPTPDRLDRAVRAAIHRFEEDLFDTIYHALPAHSLLSLDSLIATAPDDEEDERAFQHTPILSLKRDPARLSANTIIKEVEKLEVLQELNLPDTLFEHITPKLIGKYRQRAAAESPRELRSHPNPVKYTLLSAFCWQRRREITDNLVELLKRIVNKMNIRAENKVEAEFLPD